MENLIERCLDFIQSNFQKDLQISQNYDFNDVDHSPDGSELATSDDNGYLRVWNATSLVNTRSVVAYSGGSAGKVSWSGDGSVIGVSGDDDTINLYWASNLSSIHGSISADVGGGDFTYDVDLSPDGSMAAIAIGRSGNGGTNGVVRIIESPQICYKISIQVAKIDSIRLSFLQTVAI